MSKDKEVFGLYGALVFLLVVLAAAATQLAAAQGQAQGTSEVRGTPDSKIGGSDVNR